MRTSLWINEATPVTDTRGQLPQESEVVVVGAGVAGVCTALHLAERGAQVLLLERDAVASRASGRNDGQMLLGLGEHYNRIVGQFGAVAARALWDFIHENNQGLKEAIRELPCDLVEAGGLRLAQTEHEAAELREAAELMAAERLPHQLLDPAAVAERLPCEAFHGGLLLPGESVVQPARMVRGLAARAQRAGVVIREGVEVLSIAGDAGDFRIRTNSGGVTAAVVVHATSALAPELDGSGFLGSQLFPFRGQILATDRLPAAIAERFGDHAMSSNFCYEYFRLHEGRFVVGGMRWSVKGEETGITDDATTNEEVAANLMAYVRRHFPVLDGIRFPHAWTGIMAGTPDGLPLLGALPGQPGVFCNLGYNGYGLSFAWLAGRSIAEQVLDGRAAHGAAGMFAPRRTETGLG